MQLEPPDLTPEPDAAAADWFGERLRPLWSLPGGGQPVGAIVPDGFAAYARVLHPAWSGDEQRPMTWAEVASRTGREVHPEVQWHALIGQPAGHDGWPNLDDIASPSASHLDPALVAALIDVLQPFTAEPDDCVMGIWDGYGWGGDELLRTHHARSRLPRWRRRGAGRSEPAGATSFEVPTRRYYLFRTSLDGVVTLAGSHGHRANLLWPRDRAWCVATEVDLAWTYVGGSNACIDAILGDPRLEALPTRPDHRADIHGDSVN